MFCSSCGKQIPDNSTFCSGCGAQVGPIMQAQVVPTQNWGAPDPLQSQFQMQKNAVRQSEIQSMQQTIQYFMQKKDVFDEYDAVSTLVQHYAQGASSALIVWGSIIATIGLFSLSGGPSVWAFSFLFLLFPGIMMIVGGILLKVNCRKKYAYYQERYDALSQELYDHYTRYPNCPVGPEYCNPDILYSILSVLESGRADTIKESINLLINEMDRQQYNAYLEQINANTRTAAIFAAASFFS